MIQREKYGYGPNDSSIRYWISSAATVDRMIPADQIVATSHDLTPNGGLVADISYFREIQGGEVLCFAPARNARKGYNLGGKSDLLRRYKRIHRVGSWKTLFLPWVKFWVPCGLDFYVLWALWWSLRNVWVCGKIYMFEVWVHLHLNVKPKSVQDLYTLPETSRHSPWKWMVGKLPSFLGFALFLGANR